MTHSRILQGDVLAGLRTLPAASVQTCVTSPPYFGLRDYGTAKWVGGRAGCDHKNTATAPAGRSHGHSPDQPSRVGMCTPYRDLCGKCGARRIDAQIGLERTPDAYVARLVDVFREVRRVLKVDGTVWLNLGDSYNSQPGQRKPEDKPGTKQASNQGSNDTGSRDCPGLKPKNLIGIPWRVAFALQADGWYLRQDIIWAKPNPMPESVRDRCTKAHEYVFLLAKSERYFYDADAVREARITDRNRYIGSRNKGRRGGHGTSGSLARFEQTGLHPKMTDGRNRRSVWTITPKPYRGAHFAVMPEALVEPCVLAGSRPGDTVLDPFAGSGTVGAVALRLGRRFVGCELNPAYVALAEKRIAETLSYDAYTAAA